MVKLAGVTKNDVVYDLGCGDGALLIAAARLGARVVGVDIDPQRIKEATENVRKAGVQDRVTLIRGDILDPAIKISEASVVTLYLLPSLNQKLLPRLKAELKPGTGVTVAGQFSPASSGSVHALRASRMSSMVPPKREGSVSTEIALAPPA